MANNDVIDQAGRGRSGPPTNGVVDVDAEPVVIVPDKLYRLGGTVPMEGRVTWAPRSETGYQPCNTYVLVGAGADMLIIDPGLPWVEAEVLSGLRKVLPQGSRPRVFLTRAQLDCCGNLTKVSSEYAIQEVFTGGLRNPFDAFDDAASATVGWSPDSMLQRSPSEAGLEVHNAALRMLATFWGYDRDTKTLFTSDSFTHTTVRNAADMPVVSAENDHDCTLQDVRAHMLATFWWLQYADKRAIREDLQRLFETRDVEIIAPSRGCVIMGHEAVSRHVDMVLSVLSDAPERALCR